MLRSEKDAAHRERLAQGVALVKGGQSILKAAEGSGAAAATIWEAVKRLEKGVATGADLRLADQALMARSYQLAALGQEEQLRMLGAGEMAPKQVNVAVANATKAIGAWRRWKEPDAPDPGGGAAARVLDRLAAALAGGGTLSLNVSPRPVVEAVLVEASRPGSELRVTELRAEEEQPLLLEGTGAGPVSEAIKR